MPVPLPRCCIPVRWQPVTPDFLSVILPMALIMQEVSAERYIEIPEPVRDIYKPVATHAHAARGAPGEPARYPRPHLLQVRRRLAGGVAQAQHRRAAGLLQQGSRYEGNEHRDRRRSVGLRHGDGMQLLRPEPGNLHGQGQLSAKSHIAASSWRAIGAQVYASPTVRTHAGRAALAKIPTTPGRSAWPCRNP